MSQFVNRQDHSHDMRWAIPNEGLYSDVGHPVLWSLDGDSPLCVMVKGSLGETVEYKTMTGACHVGFVRSSNDLSLTLSTLSTTTWPVSVLVRD